MAAANHPCKSKGSSCESVFSNNNNSGSLVGIVRHHLPNHLYISIRHHLGRPDRRFRRCVAVLAAPPAPIPSLLETESSHSTNTVLPSFEEVCLYMYYPAEPYDTFPKSLTGPAFALYSVVFFFESSASRWTLG